MREPYCTSGLWYIVIRQCFMVPGLFWGEVVLITVRLPFWLLFGYPFFMAFKGRTKNTRERSIFGATHLETKPFLKERHLGVSLLTLVIRNKSWNLCFSILIGDPTTEKGIKDRIHGTTELVPFVGRDSKSRPIFGCRKETNLSRSVFNDLGISAFSLD